MSRLSYNPATGDLTWVAKSGNSPEINRWNTSFAGKRAGAGGVGMRGNKTSWYVSIDGHPYVAHRLIWIMVNGSIPHGAFIDHKDGNPYNNSLCNLRLSDNVSNQHNRLAPKNNTTGIKGVTWSNKMLKWKATVRSNGNYFHLGYHDTKGMAAVAAAKGSLTHHGKFSPYYRASA